MVDSVKSIFFVDLKIENPSLKIKQISFAAKLKDVSYQLYSWAGLKIGVYYESHYELKEVALPHLELSPRQIWIEVGNKMREIYSDTWINFALFGVQADILIITDLRFCNEAAAILETGGLVKKINRFNIPQGTDLAEIDLDTWGEWYDIIDNGGSLQDLHSTVDQIAKDLLKD